MKRVCHVTSIHSRYDTRIFYKECTSLARAGYEVYLLVQDEKKNEVKNNVKIISTKNKPKNRIERIISSKKMLFQYADRINADIYHFHDPDLIAFAMKLKHKKKNIKIVFDSHEDIPAQIIEKEWIPFIFRRIISFTFQKYQSIMLKNFDYLIGVTPHLVKKLKKINVYSEMVTNFPIINENDIVHKEDNKKNEILLCFAGGISKQWNHLNILKAIENIESKYIILGSYDDSNYFNQLKSQKAWTKTKYLGKVKFEFVKEVLKKCTVGLAILSYSPNTNGKGGTLGNTKIFEYMQAGLPIICTDFDIWKKIIKDNNCGICVNPNALEEIRNAIKHLKEHPEEAEIMGKNGLNAVIKQYNWKNEEYKLLNIYKDLT